MKTFLLISICCLLAVQSAAAASIEAGNSGPSWPSTWTLPNKPDSIACSVLEADAADLIAATVQSTNYIANIKTPYTFKKAQDAAEAGVVLNMQTLALEAVIRLRVALKCP